MLVKYAKMVEDTQDHNQSLIKHMASIASDNNYDSNQINTFEDEISKMKNDLESLKEAETNLLTIQ